MALRSRLSPYSIADDLIRAELYREVRDGAEAQVEGWSEYEIQPDERLMPELVAYRAYGTDDLKWVVLIVGALDNFREPLNVGETVRLPPLAWIRQRIRHYADFEMEREAA